MKRDITLAVRNISNNIENIKNICNELNLELKENNFKGTYWYFSIYGDTNSYNMLVNKFDDEIITTHLADLGNIADCDNDWLAKFDSCLDLMKKAQAAESKANNAFHNFIMPIDNIEVLKEIEKCSAYMNETQKQEIIARKDVLSGNNHLFKEEMVEVAKSLGCDVKALREKTGMNRSDFAKYFGIPYRTVEDWENKKSACSSYLFNLMEKDLRYNNLI